MLDLICATGKKWTLNKSTNTEYDNRHQMPSDIKLKIGLFNAAAFGWSKPSQDTSVDNRLQAFTTKESGEYDADFTDDMIKMRPNWFMADSAVVEQKPVADISKAETFWESYILKSKSSNEVPKI